MKSTKHSNLVMAAFLLGLSSIAVAGENAATVDEESKATFESSVDAELAPSSAITAQDLAPLTGRSSDEWQFVVTGYLWMANLSGSNTIGALTVPIDVDFSTIWDNLDGAFASHVEARKGAWGAFFDISYFAVGKDEIEISLPNAPLQAAPLPETLVPSIDFSFSNSIFEAMATYRFGNESSAFDVLGGLRYNRLAQDIVIGGRDDLSGGFDVNWTDPVFGGRYLNRVRDRVLIILRGDVGGFGAGSEFTWNVVGGVSIDVHRRIGLQFFYRYMDIEYREGTQGTKDFFEYLSTTQGVLLGVSFYF